MENKIEPDRYYTPSEIANANWFPWIKHEKSVRNWLSAEFEKGNPWKIIKRLPGKDVDAVTSKSGVRWLVPGSSIIKIRAKFEGGALFNGR